MISPRRERSPSAEALSACFDLGKFQECKSRKEGRGEPNAERSSIASVSRTCRARVRRRAALGHPKYPFDGFEIHLADVRVVPGFLSVAQCRIEDSTLAIHLVPGNGKIVIRTVDARIVVVELRRIQA